MLNSCRLHAPELMLYSIKGNIEVGSRVIPESRFSESGWPINRLGVLSEVLIVAGYLYVMEERTRFFLSYKVGISEHLSDRVLKIRQGSRGRIKLVYNREYPTIQEA